MRNRKIAVFVKNLTSGGAEKQAVLLAKALAGDYEMHYIIFNGEKVHQKYLDMLHADERVHVVSFRGGHVSRFRQFVSYLKGNKIEIVFSYLTAANLYACLAGRIVGAKVFTGLRNAELPFGRRITDRLLTNWMAEKAVANCYSGKKNFGSKGFRKNKIEVIPNGFEHIAPYSGKADNKEVKVITVGRFVAQKDYGTAVRSIAKVKAKCPQMRFQIVGYGDLEMEIRNMIKRYGIEDVTEIFINPDNISQLLDEADIYLSTSLFEGTSNSVMEGMNANMPVVATNVGDNYKLVEDHKNGFLAETKDADAIAEALLKLCKDKDLRAMMGKASKEHLQNDYSVEILRKRYIDLIGSVK